MKTFIIFIISLFMGLSYSAQNKPTKTVTFKVRGNCEQCQERIENAADIKGVKIAHWNVKKQAATVTYDTTKVTLIQIEKAIAKAGHETELEPASKESYDKLPKCCKYNDTKCEKK